MVEVIERSVENVEQTRYLAENRKEALGVLVPEVIDLPGRIPLITILKGRAPDLYALYRAHVVWTIRKAYIEAGKNGTPAVIPWEELDPAEFIRLHAPSLQGKRSQQVVDIARAAQPPEHRRSFVDMLRGRP